MRRWLDQLALKIAKAEVSRRNVSAAESEADPGDASSAGTSHYLNRSFARRITRRQALRWAGVTAAASTAAHVGLTPTTAWADHCPEGTLCGPANGVHECCGTGQACCPVPGRNAGFCYSTTNEYCDSFCGPLGNQIKCCGPITPGSTSGRACSRSEACCRDANNTSLCCPCPAGKLCNGVCCDDILDAAGNVVQRRRCDSTTGRCVDCKTDTTGECRSFTTLAANVITGTCQDFRAAQQQGALCQDMTRQPGFGGCTQANFTTATSRVVFAEATKGKGGQCCQTAEAFATFAAQTDVTRLVWQPSTPCLCDDYVRWGRGVCAHENLHLDDASRIVREANESWANGIDLGTVCVKGKCTNPDVANQLRTMLNARAAQAGQDQLRNMKADFDLLDKTSPDTTAPVNCDIC